MHKVKVCSFVYILLFTVLSVVCTTKRIGEVEISDRLKIFGGVLDTHMNFQFLFD